MLLKFVRATALLGRLFTVLLLTRFDYSNSASLLAIIFTVSTIFNSIIPPFHKEIYIKKVRGKEIKLLNIITDYIIPLIIVIPIAILILLAFLWFYFDNFQAISPNFLFLYLYLVNEKIFDELNRYSLTFKKYFPWSISCICRYLFSNILVFSLILNGSFSQTFLVNIILLFYAFSTLLPMILVIRKRHFEILYKNFKDFYKNFKIIIFFKKNLIKAWLISIVMLFPTFSERIASITGDTDNTGEMFIAISIIQLIGFIIDLQIHSTKKSEIIKNKNLKELIHKTNIIPISFFIIFLACISFFISNINDPFEDNLINIFSLLILGTSILLNSLSLIQEERLFWSKKYKGLFLEMIIISSLILLSFILLNYNTLSLSLGILFSALVRIYLSSNHNVIKY